MSAFYLDEFRQIRVIAIHAVNAFDDHQHPLELATLLFQNGVQSCPVVVRKREPFCARQLDALQRAVVYQCVMQDQVFRSKQITDGGDIGGMTADEGNGFVHVINFGKRGLELAVDRPLARNNTTRRHRGAVLIDGRLGRGRNHRIT